jgi:hypothetical protein
MLNLITKLPLKEQRYWCCNILQSFGAIPFQLFHCLLLSLSLVLENVHQVAVGRNFDLSTRAVLEPLDKNYTLALLYPSPDAIDLDHPTREQQELLGMLVPDETKQEHDCIASNDRTFLIACDRTWTQAIRMFCNSTELIKKYHLIQFTSNTTTVYNRIRTEPDDHCLSTAKTVAEALVLVLNQMEGKLKNTFTPH